MMIIVISALLIAILGVILFKNRLAKGILIVSSVVLILMAAGLYFVHNFLNAFALPIVTITSNYIATNTDFINGVKIEKIKVDSIGSENYPVKYTVTYITNCHIEHPIGKPPDPPDKIYFNKAGKYWWTEENVNIPFIHQGLSRKTTDTTYSPFLKGSVKLKTSPLKIEREQWYFITISDPQVTGIFFFINKDGTEKQIYLASGVSPI